MFKILEIALIKCRHSFSLAFEQQEQHLFHPLALTKVSVEFSVDAARSSVHCTAQVETHGKTGVEMEALTAVQVGLLTIYDMCKAVDRGMVMTDVRVLEKHGGKSGDWMVSKD